MSDKLDKLIVIAGFVALSVVLSAGLLANAGVYPDGKRQDNQYAMTAKTTLWFGAGRHF